MGFLKTTGDTELQVYLTEFGKRKMLEQHFAPAYFTLNDSDVNYVTNTVLVKVVADVSGDYDDNVFSLSKWQNIRGAIIRADNTVPEIVQTTTVSQTVLSGVTTITD
jgi:hypothetical protein